MSLFKRCTASITASFDRVISQVENHEAVVESAIREMQQAGAKARARLKRVRRDGELMRKRISDLEEMERVWEERAVRIHEEDEARALECVRRKNQVSRELKSLREQEREHGHLLKQLQSDLGTMDQRLDSLKRKKHALSARQYRAEALQLGQVDQLGVIAEVDEIFERWETRIDECEAYGPDGDYFEEEFASEEEDEDLKASLEELLKQHEEKSS